MGEQIRKRALFFLPHPPLRPCHAPPSHSHGSVLQNIGNSTVHARSGASHSPDTKPICIGAKEVVSLRPVEEEVVPLPLMVRAPWGNNDEEEKFASGIGTCTVVPPKEEEVQFASGIGMSTADIILSVLLEEEEVEFALEIGTSTANLWFKCPICLGYWYDCKSNGLPHRKLHLVRNGDA
jgi:hypothetical protein